MSTWQPQEQGLNDLLLLLRDATRPESRDQLLVQQVILHSLLLLLLLTSRYIYIVFKKKE